MLWERQQVSQIRDTKRDNSILLLQEAQHLQINIYMPWNNPHEVGC
jgi:hypothetical protein